MFIPQPVNMLVVRGGHHFQITAQLVSSPLLTNAQHSNSHQLAMVLFAKGILLTHNILAFNKMAKIKNPPLQIILQLSSKCMLLLWRLHPHFCWSSVLLA